MPAESRLTKVRENASHDADYDLRRSGAVCSEEKEQIWSEWPLEAPTVLDNTLRVAQF